MKNIYYLIVIYTASFFIFTSCIKQKKNHLKESKIHLNTDSISVEMGKSNQETKIHTESDLIEVNKENKDRQETKINTESNSFSVEKESNDIQYTDNNIKEDSVNIDKENFEIQETMAHVKLDSVSIEKEILERYIPIYAQRRASFKMLEIGWKDTGTDMKKKKKFISENKHKFYALGLDEKFETIEEVEKILVTRIDTIEEVLKLICEAEVAKQIATERYEKAYNLKERIKNKEKQPKTI